MKRFLLSLFALLITSPAFAEGRYQDGGCTAEQSDSFFTMIGILLAAFIVLMIAGYIHHTYKMKTDPVYRADWQAKERAWAEEDRQQRQRRGY